MPRFRHKDVVTTPSSKYFSSSCSRMRSGVSSSVISKPQSIGSSSSNLSVNVDEHTDDNKDINKSNDGSGTTPSQQINPSFVCNCNDSDKTKAVSTKNAHTNDNNDDNNSKAKSTSSSNNYDDDNEFEFDFYDEDSTPPKAIIWKEMSINSNNDLPFSKSIKIATVDDDNRFDFKSPQKGRTSTSGILKEKNSVHKSIHYNSEDNYTNPIIGSGNSITNRNRFSVFSSSAESTTPSTSILASPSLPLGSRSSSSSSSSSGSSKKKQSKVTFGNDVNFRQKTPIKVKRSTKKGSIHKSGINRTSSSTPALKSNASSLSRTSNVSSDSNNCISSPVRKSQERLSSSSVMKIVTPITNNNNNIPNLVDTYSSLHVQGQDLEQSSVCLSMNNNSLISSWITNRGVGIDTRVLETFSGDAVGMMFQKHVLEFLQTASTRGICPTYLATTTLKEKKQRGSTGNSTIETRSARLPFIESQKELWNKSLIPLVHVKPPSNVGNTKNRDSVHVPKRLIASDSWRLSGDLVETILSQQSNSSRKNISSPMEITIISNDIAFFTDVNIDSHKRALYRLWERLRPKFESNSLRSINFVVFESKVAAMNFQNESMNGDSNTNSNDSRTLSKPDEIVDTDDENEINVDHTPHRFKVAYCVREIRNHFVKLQEREFQQCSGREKSGMPVTFHFEMKEMNSILFSSILQQWSKDSLHSATSKSGQISFDLPETFDGNQCAISLGLSYSIFPYRLDSMFAKHLIEDIKSLSESFIEVVQLIPLNCIDMSLIYGTPITAKAGYGVDVDQYKQMQVLVRSLLDYLASHDLALVLRSSQIDAETICSSVGTESRLFLLIAQVQEEESKGGDLSYERSRYKSVGDGILYHYVNKAEHIVEEPKDEQFNQPLDADDDLISFSNIYISESLGLLEQSSLSPYDHQV